jgi:hypothetical protein
LRKGGHPLRLKVLFGAYMQPCLDFVATQCLEYIPAVSNNLVCSCFRILDAFIVPFTPVPATAAPTKEVHHPIIIWPLPISMAVPPPVVKT